MFMALHVPALLRLWRCVLSRFFALACGIDRSLSLLWRHAYGFACFLRVYVCGLRVVIFLRRLSCLPLRRYVFAFEFFCGKGFLDFLSC